MLKLKEASFLWLVCLGAMLMTACSSSSGENDRNKLIGVLPKTPGGTDYQAYYDPEDDLTWLANANANGVMVWTDAVKWAKDLNVNGVTGWRLPVSKQPDPACDMQIGGISRGFRCTGSEMGKLFYNVLGNSSLTDLCRTTGNCTKIKTTLKNTGPFKNIQLDYYWTSTPDPTDPDSAMYLDFRYGDQREVNKLFGMYAWAVHTGNVAHASTAGK